VDAYLAITSKRDEDRHADRPLPDDLVRRILEAGRVTGSANNRQPWRFVVVDDPALRERLAPLAFEPDNIRTAALLVALVATAGRKPGFDHGRAAQNMMLAAWNEGVISTPNGSPERERVSEVLGLAEDEQPVMILSFGYPARPRDVDARAPDEWAERANRKPLEELVEHR
jgi:nitroreductase